MAIANYTTKVSAANTVAEIQALLAKHGAESILVEYSSGRPAAVSFRIAVRGGNVVAFRLPSNTAGVLDAMRADKKIPRALCRHEQAERVAWRITRDWVRTQLAIIEAGLSRLEHVMLPYAITRDGRTLSQAFDESGGLPQLEAPAT